MLGNGRVFHLIEGVGVRTNIRVLLAKLCSLGMVALLSALPKSAGGDALFTNSELRKNRDSLAVRALSGPYTRPYENLELTPLVLSWMRCAALKSQVIIILVHSDSPGYEAASNNGYSTNWSRFVQPNGRNAPIRLSIISERTRVQYRRL